MNYDAYKNKIPHVRREDFIKVFVYSKGACIWSGPLSKYDGSGMLIEREFDEAAYKAARYAFQDHQSALMSKFKLDLLAEYGVSENPKAGRCFDLAWAYGHGSGFEEVDAYFADLVDLIK